MAKLRKIMRGIRRASTMGLTLIFSKHPKEHSPRNSQQPTIEPRYLTPTPYQQLHESLLDADTEQCPPVLRVRNPDTPSTPSDSPPPSPTSGQRSLDELFLGDEITPESFELQIPDEEEEEDNTPYHPLRCHPPRAASRLEMRSEESPIIPPPLDKSLFPETIIFRNSPFPILTRKEADPQTHRPEDTEAPLTTESPKIFPNPPLEQRLTRLPRRRVAAASIPQDLEIIPTQPLEQRLMPGESLQLARLQRTCNEILAAIDDRNFGLAALNIPPRMLYREATEETTCEPTPIPTNMLYGESTEETTWEPTPTPTITIHPPNLTIGHGRGSSRRDSPARRGEYSTIESPHEDPTPQRQSLTTRNSDPPFTYRGRTPTLQTDYFTYRHDKRQRFLAQDWREWMIQLATAKRLAKRLTIALENIGDFSVDFEDCGK